MAADYGTDLDGVLDWPDPEVLASGPRNLGNALARMLLTPNGALLDVDDDAEPYETLNVRDWYGARPSPSELDALTAQLTQILRQSDRVDTVSVAVTLPFGVLTVSVSGTGAGGPFAFVLALTAVNTASLEVAP